MKFPMKTYRSLNLITLLLLAMAFALGSSLRAQPAEPAPAEPPTAPAPATKAEPAKDDASEKKAVAPAAEAQANAATNTEVAVESPEKQEEKKIDSSQPADTEPTVKIEPKAKKNHRGKAHKGNRGADSAQIGFFQNSSLAAGDRAEAVVSILGSSSSAGEVDEAVVSILGSSTSSGEVGQAVVSVLGNTRVTGGTVGDAAVSVLGNTYVNGHVNGAVVAVLGNVELGPDAVVGGELVCIGGEVKRDVKAEVHGGVKNIAIAGHFLKFDWLNTWITKCLLYARPLAFDTGVMWAWWVALACLGFYALVALVVPQGVTKCVQTLEERPGYSILSSILAMLLTPVAYLLLVLTLAIGIGFILIPLFSLGLFFAAIFGKVVMLTWLGRHLTKLFGDGPISHPAFAVLIGGVIVLGLYTVPVVGFIVYKLIGLLGLGVVLYTLLRSIKSNRTVTLAPTAAIQRGVPPLVGEATQPPAVPSAVAPILPPVVSASTLPRAGFWLRFAASFLDLILVSIVFGMLSSMLFGHGGAYPLWLAIYAVVMWATKGTTIGGIICGLKVVRIDDRPLEWSVAIVRGLSAFLSLAIAGLGFIWVVFDDEKQSWHDKIAGTTIVKVPKGTPLL